MQTQGLDSTSCGEWKFVMKKGTGKVTGGKKKKKKSVNTMKYGDNISGSTIP